MVYDCMNDGLEITWKKRAIQGILCQSISVIWKMNGEKISQ